jgi:glutaminyl-peptide cyclotransferase
VLAVLMVLICAACDRPKTDFDAETALGYVRAQLEFGPRIPGSLGHRRTGEWIATTMRERADTVIEQRWTHVTASGDSLPMRNIFARIRPDLPDRVLFVAHWDTRPISDQDPNPARRALPVPGANDGGSGVALLIAIADALRKTPPTIGVDLLFVDGEDYGDFGKNEDVLIGSRYFAKNLPSPDYRPLFGVLWDMIADANLRIAQEGISVARAPEVVARVWNQAADLGYSEFFIPRNEGPITDDHLPLLDAGLRVIDVIDFDYPPHHTPDDTIDKLSAKSFQIVGDVALSLVR